MSRGSFSASNYLSIAATTDFDFNTNVLMLAILRSGSSGAVYDKIACYGNAANTEGWRLGIGPSLEWYFTKAGVGDISSSYGPAASKWYAVQAYSTHEGDVDFRIWDYAARSLTEDLAVSDSGAIVAPTNEGARIGLWFGGTSPWDGEIERVLLLQDTITADEFVYFATTGRLPAHMWPNLKHYTFCRGKSPEPDYSGNAHTAAITGSPTVEDAAPVGLTFGFDEPWGLEAAVAAGPANVKVIEGLVIASVKTIEGLAIASVKSIEGLE